MFRNLFRRRHDTNPNKTRNDAIRAELATRGDDGRTERRVVHVTSPRSGGETNATIVMDFLVLQGFEVARDEAGRGYLAAERREVASEAFDSHTAFLSKALDGFGWSYDRWQSDRPDDTT